MEEPKPEFSHRVLLRRLNHHSTLNRTYLSILGNLELIAMLVSFVPTTHPSQPATVIRIAAAAMNQATKGSNSIVTPSR